MDPMSAANAGFDIEHLPYGSFSTGRGQRLGVRFGALVLDATAAAQQGLLPEVCGAPNLDRLLAAGSESWETVRTAVVHLFTSDRYDLGPLLHPLDSVRLHLPFTVGDYVDFYSSEAHATNLGRLFRPDQPPLLPNWKYLPVGYHGRSGTVVVSGTDIRRPVGQRRSPDGSVVVGPSEKLDIELEMAVVLGGASELGEPIPIGRAADHIFGICLLNDWSARDIQAWEYVPLGPFLGKSFATSIAPWITPISALQDRRLPGPKQTDPTPLPYLQTDQPWAFDIDLDVLLQTEAMRDAGHDPVVISNTNFCDMYWSMAQQLAHMTMNGATVRPGDIYASGTISGWKPGQEGSLLELTQNGESPLVLDDGTTRTFLADGDEIILRGTAGPITLGEVRGRILANRRGTD